MDFIEPCLGIGHNLSLICQMTSEDIKHQLIIIIISGVLLSMEGSKLAGVMSGVLQNTFGHIQCLHSLRVPGEIMINNTKNLLGAYCAVNFTMRSTVKHSYQK